tara:strand:+ start:3210 stop:3737 length:528 start_codon:yes stop_codon:yes gene_type:complete
MTNKEHAAIAKGRNLSISTKHATEICNFIRGKSLQKSKALLQEVVERKTAVPFKVFNNNMGHRSGKIASGRYPEKAANEIINLLNSAESNAQNKGLNVETLFISAIIPNQASRPAHFGRKRGKMKRTHVDIKVEEKEVTEKKAAKKKKVPESKEKTLAEKSVQKEPKTKEVRKEQ